MNDPTTESRARVFDGVVESVEQLRTMYRPPMKYVAEKKRDHLLPWIRATVEASRFVFLATSGADGSVTVSPRGGHDGFVAVLDDRHLALPDYPGNNLTDSLTNIVTNPHAGLIFVIPGRNETVRVDGRALVVTDPEVLAACEQAGGRRPKAAIVIEIHETFFHCPASFQRAGLWNSEGWREDAALDYDAFIREALDPADWPDWAVPGSADDADDDEADDEELEEADEQAGVSLADRA